MKAEATFVRRVSPAEALVAVVAFAVAPIAVGVGVFLATVAAGAAGLEWLAPGAYAAVGLAAVIAYRRRGWTWRELGFVPMGVRGWHVLWQAPLALVVVAVATAFVGGVLLGMEPAGASDATAGSGGGLMAAVAVYVVIGPVVEEIAFRRFAFGGLEDLLRPRVGAAAGVTVAALTSSAIFGAAHVVGPVMLWTFFLGLGCAILTRRHRSLWAGCALHWQCNGFVVAVAAAALLA